MLIETQTPYDVRILTPVLGKKKVCSMEYSWHCDWGEKKKKKP